MGGKKPYDYICTMIGHVVIVMTSVILIIYLFFPSNEVNAQYPPDTKYIEQVKIFQYDSKYGLSSFEREINNWLSNKSDKIEDLRMSVVQSFKEDPNPVWNTTITTITFLYREKR